MPKYIKSHSNYRLSTKHQNVNGGKILERDITTIGGISPFAMGQNTIHSSGNFIIAINDSTGPSRHIKKGGWVNNDMSGATWTHSVLMNQASDVNASIEKNIVLKNDYMDFRTFACYGSLADLVENSIGDILERFPYEIYTDEGDGEYMEYTVKGSLDATELTYEGMVSGRGSKTYGADSAPTVVSLGDYIPSVSANGVTDNTEEFQEALNAMSNDSVLYIPNGKYRISNCQTLRKGIKITGASKTDVKIYNPTSGPTFIVKGKNGVEISNVTFYNNTGSAIECESEHCSFHDINAYNVSKVVSLLPDEEDNIRKGNVCYNIYAANGACAVYATAQENCKIYSIKGTNMSQASLYITNSTNPVISNISLTNEANACAVYLDYINEGSLSYAFANGCQVLKAYNLREFDITNVLAVGNYNSTLAVELHGKKGSEDILGNDRSITPSVNVYNAHLRGIYCFGGKAFIKLTDSLIADCKNIRIDTTHFTPDGWDAALLIYNANYVHVDGVQISVPDLTGVAERGGMAITIAVNNVYGSIENCGIAKPKNGTLPVNIISNNCAAIFNVNTSDLTFIPVTSEEQGYIADILAENDADINDATEKMTDDSDLRYEISLLTRGHQKAPFEINVGYDESEDEEAVEEGDLVNMYVKNPASATITIYSGITAPHNVEYVNVGGEGWYVISNPGNVNIHAVNVEECENVDPLKYFANDGYLNYGIFFDQFDPTPDDGYSFDWVSQLNCYTAVDNGGSISINFDSSEDPRYFSVYFNENISFEGIVDKNLGNYLNKNGIVNAKAGETYYFRAYTDNGTTQYEVMNEYCPQIGDFVAKITITPRDCDVWTRVDDPIIIRAYRDKDLNVVYLVREKDFHIHFRPKQSLSFFDNFKDSLNLFQKTILGDFSGVKNTAKFEVIKEGEYGYTKKLQTFVFPSNHGGWNPGGDGLDMVDYVRTLMNIGLEYDEKYSDNIYRSMTHEAMKNLDWTRGFNGQEDNNHYIQTGEKFKSIIRTMGFFFDQEKAYIDCIGNANALTYNNRANLSDYFISDKLELDGWVLNNISTYSLYEYDDANDEVYEEFWTDNNQKKNYYKRVFVEDTNEIACPYCTQEKASYWIYDSDEKSFKERISNEETPSCAELFKSYTCSNDYTAIDINNEFMKRLAINSKHILRKKGTIDGIEQLLSLLGFRSKHWYGELPEDVRKRYYDDRTGTNPYDYDINEYTAFAIPLQETWDVEHDMYQIDYYNSCKTIAYQTDDFMNGIYVPYQGLPVAYRDCENKWLRPNGTVTTDIEEAVINSKGEAVKARYLYPYFDKNCIYDGGLYYQMKGGWINYAPYSFDTNSNAVPNDDMSAYKETLRDVRQTSNLQTLIDIPQSFLNEGTIIYVNDLSKNMAIIDGHTYDLIPEKRDGITYYYFTLEVKDNSVWLGDNLYENFIAVSNPDGSDGIVRYCIPALQEGSVLKVYYDEQYSDKFFIKGYDSVSYYHTEWEGELSYSRECDSSEPDAYEVYENEIFPTTMVAFINGSYNEDYSNYSHYFILDNVNYYDLIGNDGWRQLSIYDPEYLRIDPIQDDFKGNNPHSGNGGYDSGYSYMEAFKRLFGYALDNEYFNENNFKSLTAMYEELSQYGFSGITEEDMNGYLGKLRVDTKVHGMLDRIGEFDTTAEDKLDDTNEYSVKYYDQINGLSDEYSGCCLNYDLTTSRSLYYADGYKNTISSLKGSADSVTSQIMNTKVIEFIFYLGNSPSLYRKDVQEKIKYIQCKIMPYIEQMLPSTAIPIVHFVSTPFIFDPSSEIPKGFWHNEYFLTSDGIWPEDVSNITIGNTRLSNLDYTEDDRLVSTSENIKIDGQNYFVYTFMPEESGEYTISFTYDNSSTLLPNGMNILNYEYSVIERASVSGSIYNATLKMVKDTHYKIALGYSINDHNPSGRKFDGDLTITKNS